MKFMVVFKPLFELAFINDVFPIDDILKTEVFATFCPIS